MDEKKPKIMVVDQVIGFLSEYLRLRSFYHCGHWQIYSAYAIQVEDRVSELVTTDGVCATCALAEMTRRVRWCHCCQDFIFVDVWSAPCEIFGPNYLVQLNIPLNDTKVCLADYRYADRPARCLHGTNEAVCVADAVRSSVTRRRRR